MQWRQQRRASPLILLMLSLPFPFLADGMPIAANCLSHKAAAAAAAAAVAAAAVAAAATAADNNTPTCSCELTCLSKRTELIHIRD